MERVLVVAPHALEHSLTIEEVEYAWTHARVKIERENEEDILVRIGPVNEFAFDDGTLRDFVGMVARRSNDIILIFHAKRPPVGSLIDEVKKALEKKGKML